MEVYKFRTHKQKEGQSLDEFVTELRNIAKTCEFTNVDKEILSQVIQNCKSNRLRRRALREPDKTLNDILTLGRTLEMADTQATEMERETTVNKITNTNKTYPKTNYKQQRGQQASSSYHNPNYSNRPTRQTQCRNCGGQFPHKNGPCPANGKTCNACHKQNHFAKTLVRQSISWMIKHIKTLALQNLTKNDIKLLPYGGGKPLEVTGACELGVETKHKYGVHKFYVVRGGHGALIGYPTASQLGLVKIIQPISIQAPEKRYPDVFRDEIGKYTGGSVKLHIDTDIRPVAQRNRKTAFHIRPKVEKEIQKLLDQDIIEKIGNTPTPWVSPIVTPPKKNPEEIRLCVDMREANKAIIRERHLLPTVEELIHDLNHASVFSKLDLRAGYHQLELQEPSRYITTFSTHMGLFRYKRLNFGISSASEIFQETIRCVIQNVQNAKNISDDIIIYGKSQEEHDEALNDTLQALQRNGLTVNS
ncbi:Hypothetical predicted protein [Mytilus galloprovincialis]|uniref:Reverse transcriptase domain-containing protein n=1 Tax=Mytilus galloprovincialis TaxID=29158 RepID=A0A8B6HPN1_MYTGA|nr:Hypothetical predicted protein [Mytilus galloprovincialis]